MTAFPHSPPASVTPHLLFAPLLVSWTLGLVCSQCHAPRRRSAQPPVSSTTLKRHSPATVMITHTPIQNAAAPCTSDAAAHDEHKHSVTPANSRFPQTGADGRRTPACGPCTNDGQATTSCTVGTRKACVSSRTCWRGVASKSAHTQCVLACVDTPSLCATTCAATADHCCGGALRTCVKSVANARAQIVRRWLWRLCLGLMCGTRCGGSCFGAHAREPKATTRQTDIRCIPVRSIDPISDSVVCMLAA